MKETFQNILSFHELGNLSFIWTWLKLIGIPIAILDCFVLQVAGLLNSQNIFLKTKLRITDEIQNHFILEHLLEHIYAERKKET